MILSQSMLIGSLTGLGKLAGRTHRSGAPQLLRRGWLKDGSTWLGVVEEEGRVVGWRFVKGLDKLHTVMSEALMIQKHSFLG